MFMSILINYIYPASYLLTIFCIMFRGIIFKNRDEKWYKTLVPIYNKYIIGKLSDSKKLGAFTGLFNFLTHIMLLVSMGTIMNVYQNVEDLQLVYDELGNPAYYTGKFDQSLINLSYVFLYITLGLTIISFLLWVILTYKFSVKQKSSTWWMIIWGFIPTIAYFYYALVYKKVYIPDVGLMEIKIHREKT